MFLRSAALSPVKYCEFASARLLEFCKNPRPVNFRYPSNYVDQLLRMRANPNHRDTNGDSVIHHLIKQPKVFQPHNSYEISSVINSLHRRGANILALNHKKQTPWYYAMLRPEDSISQNFITRVLNELECTHSLDEKIDILRSESLQAIEESRNHHHVLKNYARLASVLETKNAKRVITPNTKAHY